MNIHTAFQKVIASLLICLTLAVCARAQTEPLTSYVRDDAARNAEIEVDANQPAAFTIPPTIFGTFTENIWDAVYGGVWAQVLHNPSFEPDYLSAGNIADAVRYGRLVTDPSFGSGFVRVEPLAEETGANRNRFLRSSSQGLPLPWEELRPAGMRYEPRDGDAPNSNRSLLIMGLKDREVGVRQGIYLPVHRTRYFSGSFWVKRVGVDMRHPIARVAIPVVISLRRRDVPDDVLARTSAFVIIRRSSSKAMRSDGWVQYGFTLNVPANKIASLEKIDFCISLDDERRVLIDDVRLFPADHIEGFDPEIIRLSRELKTPLLRFGGNFVSGYHWQDGVGAQEKRRTMLNQAWGLPEYNHFGTDEFIRLCRLIGAEPQISVNAGSGTPEEAAAWVEYCNGDATKTKYGKMRAAGGHAAPYNVRLWEVGNELWGDFQIGWQTAEANARRYNEFTNLMRKADPKIRFIATGADVDFFREWNGELIRQASANLDSISTHLVIGMQPAEQQARNADDTFTHKADLAVPVGTGRKLDEMHAQLQSDSRTRGRVKLAFTEWQFWSPREQDPRFTNLGGAINSAAFFNMLLRRADFVPISNMSNLVQFAGIHRQRGQVFVAPSYHVLRLYSDTVGWRPVALRLRAPGYDVQAGNRRLPEIPNVPDVDALALLSPDGGTLRVYLVNRHLTKSIRAKIALRTFDFDGRATMRRLHAKNLASANSPEDPLAVVVKTSTLDKAGIEDLTLPAHSLTVIEFERRNN